MRNKIVENIKNGKQAVGTFTHMKSMEAIEAIAVTGMDFIVIDMEHCPVDISEAAKYITAATGSNLTPLVRVSDMNRSSILKPLDIGAKGLIVPCIKTVAEVKKIVEWTKFKPIGERGYCMSRDGKWGYGETYAEGLPGYMKDANEDNLLILQCETVECLENIEEIISMDGVDGIMIGPYDLSIAMGIPGQFDNPEFSEAIEKILNACKKAGKISFSFCGNSQDAKKKMEHGFDCAIIGIDILTLISAYKALVSELK